LMSSEPTPPRKEAFYFCDETSFLNEEYMAVGGLALPKPNLKAVTDRIKAIKLPHREEVKWTRTKHWNLEIRKEYIDCLVDLIDKRQVHFHIRFAPFTAYDHSGKRRRFDTVSKMFYQLLLHRAVRHYGDDYDLLVRPDNGEYVPALEAEGFQRYSKSPCIKNVICLDSEREPLLQLLDVSLGALTAYRNKRHINFITSAAKTEIATYAFEKFGKRDLSRNYDDGRRLS
jgi:hypothetical protein